MKQNNIAFLSLGSNLGDKKKNLLNANQQLHNHKILILKKSHIYETEPVEIVNQPNFYNQVIKIKTKLAPDELLETLLASPHPTTDSNSMKHTSNANIIRFIIIPSLDLFCNFVLFHYAINSLLNNFLFSFDYYHKNPFRTVIYIIIIQ